MRSRRAAHPYREDRDHQLDERCLDTGTAAAGTRQTKELSDRCLVVAAALCLWPQAWWGADPRGISHSCRVKLSASEKHGTARRHNPALKLRSKLEDQLATLSAVLVACRWCSPRIADVHRRCRQARKRPTQQSRNMRREETGYPHLPLAERFTGRCADVVGCGYLPPCNPSGSPGRSSPFRGRRGRSFQPISSACRESASTGMRVLIQGGGPHPRDYPGHGAMMEKEQQGLLPTGVGVVIFDV